ncbi:retroviral-like aspartic protease family protein [Caulobacter sp. UNC358MFTsu5.1]|uniref:retroviral-like aspartic protease family protein n=1 Tax=Caulobacter sp. UNC358MFTsu5.1 TaxID=1449049 RepID=UPI0004A75522|nr:retroviral-like aspartic protease family protein [Caulobacter sp. UNC358MFTsu5.1]
MLTRRNIAAGLGLSLMAEQAWARSSTPAALLQPASLQTAPTPPPPAPPPGVTPPVEEAPPIFLDTALDAIDRMTVEVFINGQGPFAFVVDTGADRSALSTTLAAKLALERGPDVMLHGVGGSALTPTAKVPLMVAGDSRMRNAELPVLSPERLGVDGLLGVDMLDDRNVIMDFRRKRLEVRRSTSMTAAYPGVREVSVVADARFGRLAVANARVSGVRCVAFIDSGSGASMGNMALAEAIKLRVRRKPEPSMAIRLVGAAGEATVGELRVVRSIEMGALRMTNLPLVLADLHIFDIWNLNSRPAVLLGVDVLKMFARVELDFGSDRVKFRLGKGWTPPILEA